MVLIQGERSESVDNPNEFLVLRDGLLRSIEFEDTELYRLNATFFVEEGFSEPSAIALRLYKNSELYLRHTDRQLTATTIESDSDQNDATFYFSEQEQDFNEPYDREPIADPSVILVDDQYLSVEFQQDALVVRHTEQFENIPHTSATAIYMPPNEYSEVWAPEIVKIGERYYVYLAMKRRIDEPSERRTYAFSTSDPFSGNWSMATEVELPDDRWAIDAVPFYYENQWWITWSGWEEDIDGEQQIYVSRMSSPVTASGERYLISRPNRSWERLDTPYINEAPQPIIDPAGRLHIVYSVNGSWDQNYSLADLRLVAGGDPTQQADWFKSNGALFSFIPDILFDGISPTQNAKGVGHHSFALTNGDVNDASTEAHVFMYHGVPADEDPEDFWSARHWYPGTYQWRHQTTYTKGPFIDTGWSFIFHE